MKSTVELIEELKELGFVENPYESDPYNHHTTSFVYTYNKRSVRFCLIAGETAGYRFRYVMEEGTYSYWGSFGRLWNPITDTEDISTMILLYGGGLS